MTFVDYAVLIDGLMERQWLLYPLLILFLVVLFYTLYSIADRHLTWSLEHLSRYCRLSPSMAGLTFLALGNGAPDFFTGIFGAQEAPELIIGSSIGSSLFVGMFVLGIALAFQKSGTCVATFPISKNVLFYLASMVLLGVLIFSHKVTLLPLALMLVTFAVHIGWSVALHFSNKLNHQREQRQSSDAKPQASVVRQLIQETAYDQLHALPLYRRIPHAFAYIWRHDTNGTVWGSIQKIATSIFQLVQNLSILPLQDPEGADRAPELVACLHVLHRCRVLIHVFFSSLLWKAAFFDLFRWRWWEVVLYLLNGIACAIFYWHNTSWRRQPNFYWFHVILGFSESIVWIYVASRELVVLLEAIGSHFNVDRILMGTTILAWGNSFGDLVSVFALARNGHLETAITACFCGPIQNVLLTLGVSLSLSLKLKPFILLKGVQTSIIVAWGLCIVSALAFLLLGFLLFAFKYPRWLGFVLIAMYAVGYVPILLLSFAKVIPP